MYLKIAEDSKLNKTLSLTLLVIVFGNFFALQPAAAKKRVSVNARASQQFIDFREQNDFAPLNYVFAQGEFFGDSTHGKRIAEVEFNKLLTIIAEDLVAQEFYPTTESKTADMLIVVHWGGVEKFDDPTKRIAIEKVYDDLFSANNPEGSDYVHSDPMETRFDLVQDETDRLFEEMTDAKMARLLGFDEDLERERRKVSPTALEETLLTRMQQERYLVILMAWDNRALQEKGEKKLLWSAHLSMKTLGTNFEEAVAYMSEAGGDYYGLKTDGIKSRRYQKEHYEVELGDIEVVSREDAQPDENSKDTSRKPKKANP